MKKRNGILLCAFAVLFVLSGLTGCGKKLADGVRVRGFMADIDAVTTADAGTPEDRTDDTYSVTVTVTMQFTVTAVNGSMEIEKSKWTTPYNSYVSMRMTKEGVGGPRPHPGDADVVTVNGNEQGNSVLNWVYIEFDFGADKDYTFIQDLNKSFTLSYGKLKFTPPRSLHYK